MGKWFDNEIVLQAIKAVEKTDNPENFAEHNETAYLIADIAVRLTIEKFKKDFVEMSTSIDKWKEQYRQKITELRL